jgi:putative transposase
MGKQRHTAEQIIGKLREAEVLTSNGMPMEEVLRQLGISDATYYKWRKEYGSLRVDQAKRLKELEQENSKLRKVIVCHRDRVRSQKEQESEPSLSTHYQHDPDVAGSWPRESSMFTLHLINESPGSLSKTGAPPNEASVSFLNSSLLILH